MKISAMARFLKTWLTYFLWGVLISTPLIFIDRIPGFSKVISQQNLVLLVLGTTLFAVTISNTVSFQIPSETRKTIIQNIKQELAQIRIYSLLWLVQLIVANVIVEKNSDSPNLFVFFLNTLQYGAVIYYIRRFTRIPKLQDQLYNSVKKEQELILLRKESVNLPAKSQSS